MAVTDTEPVTAIAFADVSVSCLKVSDAFSEEC